MILFWENTSNLYEDVSHLVACDYLALNSFLLWNVSYSIFIYI